MPQSLLDTRPGLRERFLAELRRTRNVNASARAVGVSMSTPFRWRARDPLFARDCAEAMARGPVRRTRRLKMTADQRRVFLDALGNGTSARAAARMVGVPSATLRDYRNRDAEFASAWALARATARELAEDELMYRALYGFERVTIEDGVERRVVTQEWRPLLKLVQGFDRERARTGSGSGRYRTIELTPEAVAAARAKVTRLLILRGA